MVELQHRQQPPAELTQFQQQFPNAPVQDWESPAFQNAKNAAKAALNADQGGLCVYCEKQVPADRGHVEHIKPNAGPNAHPHLCFTYTNLAQSCLTRNTCGQKKSNAILPIEPGPNCNADWTLSTDGTIEPRPNIAQAREAEVTRTRDLLGLNDNADLVDERKRWFDTAYEVFVSTPAALPTFLQANPYRHILATAF